MEFGLRRAQGPNGAMFASRAAFIGGAESTSNTLAGKEFGIPVRGTMAHAWIMSFPSELEAFKTYASLYPNTTTFLIDTYDTLHSGINNAIIAGGELVKQGHNFGVRLDSGDMQYLSTRVRKRLDEAGFSSAGITVSNDLSEEIIEGLMANGAPINSWGVGTQMVTGGDEASFSGVYKLSARTANVSEKSDKGGDPFGFISVMKFSDNPEKTTNPGIKNVWRLYDENHMALADVIALEHETIKPHEHQVFFHPSIDYRHFPITPANAAPMLKKRLEGGKRVEPPLSAADEIKAARATMEAHLSSFDATFKRTLNPHVYKVSISPALKDLKLSFIEARLDNYTGAPE
jgi:nicotinate phosphoribosyltransferase